jgi:hypothetical protein
MIERPPMATTFSQGSSRTVGGLDELAVEQGLLHQQ